MKKALIAGSTGLVGSYVLQELLNDEYYDRVVSLVRHKTGFSHPRLVEVVFDYQNPDYSLLEADHIYCCLGTTIKKAGSRKAFQEVDYEYPLMLAEETHRLGAEAFAIVTAIGANPRSAFFYSRVKGIVEEKISALGFKAILIMRPSMLLGKRNEFRFGEEAGKLLGKVFGFMLPSKYKGIHASQVAACMVEKTKNAPDGILVTESDEMQPWPVKN